MPPKPEEKPEVPKRPDSYIPGDVRDHVRTWVEGLSVHVAWSDGVHWFELNSCIDEDDAYHAIEKAVKNVRKNRELRREFE